MLDLKPNSRGNRFRRARMALLNELVAGVLRSRERCRIVDIGGTEGFWQTWGEEVDWQRVEVTCVNLDPSHYASEGGNVRVERGNACDLSEIADGAYDLAFSNSVIEHVGQWEQMRAMANEVRRVACGYLVQTPYFWFPVEPHARTPLLHWVPESLAYRVVMKRQCGYWSKRKTVDSAVRAVQSAKLLDRAQMRSLFPDAEVKSERFAGLTKSLIAIRPPA